MLEEEDSEGYFLSMQLPWNTDTKDYSHVNCAQNGHKHADIIGTESLKPFKQRGS
jgi:hypothetical protein